MEMEDRSTGERAMITVKEAVSAATRFAREMYGQNLDLLLEEVDRELDGSWLITLSFLPQTGNALAALASKRSYKIFQVDAETGEVRSMKIRAVA
jgi:hypothetical protein